MLPARHEYLDDLASCCRLSFLGFCNSRSPQYLFTVSAGALQVCGRPGVGVVRGGGAGAEPQELPPRAGAHANGDNAAGACREPPHPGRDGGPCPGGSCLIQFFCLQAGGDIVILHAFEHAIWAPIAKSSPLHAALCAFIGTCASTAVGCLLCALLVFPARQDMANVLYVLGSKHRNLLSHLSPASQGRLHRSLELCCFCCEHRWVLH